MISIPLSFFAGIGGASNAGVLVKGSNYLETLSQTKYVVFDKTGTMTQGVFEVNGIHHNKMENEKLLEYAALAESASSHPISKSLQRAYGREPDRSRVSDIKEISGNGVTAKVDGISVAAGNAKLMKRLGIEYIDCHSIGTIIHMAVDGTLCRAYRDLGYREAPCQRSSGSAEGSRCAENRHAHRRRTECSGTGRIVTWNRRSVQ